MAAPPLWGFGDLSTVSRWVLAHGLPSELSPPDRPLADTAWEALRQDAARHGLEGLLVHAVASGALPATDAQTVEAAEVEVRLTLARLRYEDQIAGPLDVLHAAGIDVQVLKGLALAHLDHPDEQLRPTSDLDLLVRGEQIGTAVEALRSAGGEWTDPEPTPGWLRLVGKGATVRMPDGLEVDLHRLLLWGPFGVRMRPEELWQGSRPLELAGRTLHAPGREETLVHLCGHLLVLGAVRAREVRDVAQLACHPDLDGDRALDLARRWGQEALVATAVRMADRELRLSPEAHPLQAWAAGFAVTPRDRLWLRTEAPVGRLRGLEQLAVWLELDAAEARRVLWRGNVRPVSGTYASPLRRLARLARSISGRT